MNDLIDTGPHQADLLIIHIAQVRELEHVMAAVSRMGRELAAR